MEVPDAVLAGGFDEVPRQPDPEPPVLEPVLDERRILGAVSASLPLVANDPGDLVGELSYGPEEPQFHRTTARPPDEPLQSRRVLSPYSTHRYAGPIPES